MSIEFNDARCLDMICEDLVWSDWRRGMNRALIASLADGSPPFTPEESESANVKTNVNDLRHTGLLHDARSQYANGFLQQGQYFTAKTDRGPMHKREIYSAIVEKEFNRPLLESIRYFETKRSQFALLVLHGISPTVWENSYCVIPKSISVADALVPSDTELGFDGLPVLVFRKSMTAMKLAALTEQAKRDPGWNMDYVKDLLKYVDREMRNGLAGQYNTFYKPEQWEQDNKQQADRYMADRVPTIDVFDVYCFVEATDNEPAGWVRRMILDSWGNPGPGASGGPQRRTDRGGLDKTSKGDFIFSSRKRPVADSWENIATFSYADLTAVAPFYHNSVRSLGWMTYALCHIGNRLKCRVYDSVFEALIQYFQVSSMSDTQRAMKVELASMGFVDDTIKFVKASDRWQPNANWIELGLEMNEQDIESNSKSWTQNVGNQGGANTEKTKFQYMAELQKLSMLVGTTINQAHRYSKYEGREIFRRLLMPNSKDPAARTFRVNCLRQGVPEEILVPEAWTVESEKMMGQGNQTLELMVAQELLQMAPGLDPEPQRIAKRNFILALTHNPTMALELMPENPAKATPATDSAAKDAGALLQGVDVPVLTGVNHQEYIGAMLKILAQRIQKGNKSPQKMVDAKELQGMQMIANQIAKHIKILSQDKTMKQFVKQAGDALGKLVNEIKGFQQRLMAAMKKQQETAQKGNGHGGGEVAAKVLPAIIAAKTKAKIKESEAKQKQTHKDLAFMQELKHKKIRTQADVAALDLQTAAAINRGGMKSFDEGGEG